MGSLSSPRRLPSCAHMLPRTARSDPIGSGQREEGTVYPSCAGAGNDIHAGGALKGLEQPAIDAILAGEALGESVNLIRHAGYPHRKTHAAVHYHSKADIFQVFTVDYGGDNHWSLQVRTPKSSMTG
jgi:hypothetical protein